MRDIEWPQTIKQLEARGWIFERRGYCQGKTCHRTISWWRDNAGKWIPLEQAFKTDPTQLVRHHMLCPDVNDFKSKPVAEKRAKPVKEEKPKVWAPAVMQGKLF
jgi:hypothetical protein